MKKNRIRLTESQLNRVIRESVKNVLHNMQLNESSDQLIFNAHKAIDDRYDKYLDGKGDFGKRRERQYALFDDEIEKRIRRGSPEIERYMERIKDDFDFYGELEDTADSNYFERQDTEDAIADKYGLSKAVASELLARYLSKTYGRYMTGNVYGDNSLYK